MACLSVSRCRRCRLLLSSSISQPGDPVERRKEKSMVDHWCDDHGDGDMVNAFYWHDGASFTL